MAKLFLTIGGINAFLAVALGAFGAHALKSYLSPEWMQIYHTGNQYHFYHAIGLLVIGLIAVHLPESGLLKWSGWLMLTGIILFSGSLYLLAVTRIQWLGAITPFGGIAFLGAWVLMVIAVLKGL